MYDITPRHKFLVGIDSDGCAFDTMELKHKECFIPDIILHYDLQGMSKYAREAAEFVNLYSRSRGINRFPALIETLEWLQKRPEVQARGTTITIPAGLVAWMKRETKLANPALEAEVKKTGDPDLTRALAWSKAVNEMIGRMVSGVPPFPLVRESLARLASQADLLVVSATPNEALHREWEEHDLAKYVVAICGQEIGTKKEVLVNAKNIRQSHADDRRCAGRLSSSPGQRHALLSDQSRGRRGQLAAIARRGDRSLSFRAICRRISARVARRVQQLSARAAPLAEMNSRSRRIAGPLNIRPRSR